MSLYRIFKKTVAGLGYGLKPLHGPREFPLTLKRLLRIIYITNLFNKIPEGDIVECGVGKGFSLSVLSALAHKEGKGRKIYGFDSFQGFPKPSKEDESSRHALEGDTWKLESYERVRATLGQAGLMDMLKSNQIRLEKGFFQDTLPHTDIQKIALLHIDVDLYESYKVCLEFLYPKVISGGVVMFDEYGTLEDSQKWPGAKRAIDEYLQGKGEVMLKDESVGKYFFIKK